MKTRNYYHYHTTKIILAIAVVLATLCICGPANAATPEWSIIQITDNDYRDSYPQISGTNLVWYGNEGGSDSEIFFHNALIHTTTQVTDNSYQDYDPQISGTNVVWNGIVGGGYGEILLYDALTETTTQVTDNSDGDQHPHISGTNIVWRRDVFEAPSQIISYDVLTETTTQITNQCYYFAHPRISGTNLVWGGRKIFFYDGLTGTTTQITDTSATYDKPPQISGTNLVWNGGNYPYYEIFFYDASTGWSTQITDNSYDDWDPQISGTNAVWCGHEGDNDGEILFYDALTGITTQLTDNSYDDYSPRISGTNVVWCGYDNDGEIFFYDASTGITTQITDNSYHDLYPQISGTNVVWRGYDGSDYEIFMAVPTTYYYVNGTTGSDSYDGLMASWDGVHGPKLTIQAGINAAPAGAIVTVADGEYIGPLNRNLDFNGKSIILRSETGAQDCIIDCQNFGRGFYFHSGETPTTVVDGFMIQNGYQGGAGKAGNIHCDSSSPTIRNCTMRNGNAIFGGGIYCYLSSPKIANCRISDNSIATVIGSGGGIYCYQSSSPTITDCIITGNNASVGAAVFCNENSSPAITNCMISDNNGIFAAGGIYCSNNSNPAIMNCTITGNSASPYGDGGRIYCDASSPTIINCTITGNSAGDPGGGIYCYDYSSPTITNCILWADSPDEIYVESGTPVVTYSDVQGGTAQPWFGAGCIDTDPLFVRGALHNYYLSQTAAGQSSDSPCVDAGSDTAEKLGLDELTTRSDGMPDEGIVDMGYHAPYALWIDSIMKNGDDITIHWNAWPTISYVVEFSYNLELWHGFGVGEVTEVTDYGGGLLPQLYYRVRRE